jgi:hypothetical protein
MITHIPVMIITILPAKYFPELSLNLAPLFNAKLVVVFVMFNTKFTDVFVPYLPLLSHKVPDLATGVLTFLEWDLYIGSTALLLWALLLYQNAKTERKVHGTDASLLLHNDLLLGGIVRNHLQVKIFVWTLVSGPMGALAVLLWERDRYVFSGFKSSTISTILVSRVSADIGFCYSIVGQKIKH